MKREFVNRFFSKAKENSESGFSNLAGSLSSRLLTKNGQFNVIRTGTGRFSPYSLIHELITMHWIPFLFVVFVIYLVLNFIYALLYYTLGMNQFMGVVSTNPFEEFREAFFFSAQTLTTVGYGRLNPVGFWANVIATIEALNGLLIFSIGTGLVYSRFSRQKAQLVFSSAILVSPFKEGKALMFRVANKKNNDLSELEAEAIASLLVFDGETFQRKYFDLTLERKNVTTLHLSWTLVHPIDENSPIFGLNSQTCEEFELEVLIRIKAFDSTFSQQVQKRHSYSFKDLVWNARFLPTFRRSEDGHHTVLELNKLGSFELYPTNSPD